MMERIEPKGEGDIVGRLEERINGYGALKQSALTAIVMTRAIEEITTLRAELAKAREAAMEEAAAVAEVATLIDSGFGDKRAGMQTAREQIAIAIRALAKEGGEGANPA